MGSLRDFAGLPRGSWEVLGISQDCLVDRGKPSGFRWTGMWIVGSLREFAGLARGSWEAPGKTSINFFHREAQPLSFPEPTRPRFEFRRRQHERCSVLRAPCACAVRVLRARAPCACSVRVLRARAPSACSVRVLLARAPCSLLRAPCACSVRVLHAPCSVLRASVCLSVQLLACSIVAPAGRIIFYLPVQLLARGGLLGGYPFRATF